MTGERRAETIALYHVPRSQVWEGSRGRQSGRVHLHVNGRALCGVRSPWYPRDPLPTEQRCSRCAARAEREGIAWPLTAGDQGERPDGTGRVAPADGCAERQSTVDPVPTYEKVEPHSLCCAECKKAREEAARLRDEREDARAMTRIANSRAARLRDGLREAKWLIGAGLPHTMEWHDRADAWYTEVRALLPEDGAATPGKFIGRLPHIPDGAA